MSTRSDNYEKKCVQELISLGYDASWVGGSYTNITSSVKNTCIP